ncbi:MAG: hypothetical protein IK092_03820 [Muribaculaceae bacterium]|nr:hypothetical protein [Muribaculaceae bacterium]
MKRFSFLSVMLLASVAALACGPWLRPHYYVYSVYNRSGMESEDEKFGAFWNDYLGSEPDGYWSMTSLYRVDIENMAESDNLIVSTARERNDTETLEYLQLLISYLQMCNEADIDTWEYPSRDMLEKAKVNFRYIANRAKTYTGVIYKPQYALLAMRCFTRLNDYSAVMNYWDKNASHLGKSVYRDMSMGLYARALLRNGEKEKAYRTYAELGDMRSLKWCVRHQRNVEGIKKEYKEDPNNPTLLFLVQDLVNNSFDGFREYPYDPNEDEELAIGVTQSEAQQFITFAERVIKEKKTKSPAMWQAALGFVNYELNNPDLAIKQLTAAMKMEGTERMRDNARACLFYVKSKVQSKPDKNFDDYVQSEFAWLQKKSEQEAKPKYGSNNHYFEVITDIALDILAPKYQEWGRTGTAMAMMEMVDAHGVALGEICGTEYWGLGEEKVAIDNLTAQETIEMLNWLKSKKEGKLDRWLAEQSVNDNPEDALNDLIGTKFMREGRFDDALPYLEKVPVSYMSTLAISYYMSMRDYTKERWLYNQWSKGGPYYEEPTKLSSNQKVKFCKDVIALNNKLKTPQNAENEAKTRYQLATMLYQGSYKGQCWYLTRYGQSVYDTVCYKNECDLVARTVEELTKASKLTSDFKLKEKCLYALAYVPFGEDLVYYTYDENYNSTMHYNTKSHMFAAMSDLANFARANRSKLSKFTSKCDMLRTFMAKY